MAACGGDADQPTSPAQTDDTGAADNQGTGDEADLAQMARVMLDCLRDQGVDAQLRDDGGIVFDAVPREKRDEITKICDERLEEAGFSSNVEPTDADLRTDFARLQGIQQCLEEAGYAVPPFVSEEEYLSRRGDVPHPYSHLVKQLGDRAFEDMERDCPQR